MRTTPLALVVPVRIAVLIVNWNSGPLLRTCLLHLARQTRPADRVIVVDNGSQDDSLAAVGAAYTGAEVIRLETNAGFAEANNVGARAAADCDWLATLNPDAMAAPGWLAALAGAAEREPSIASFGCLMETAGDTHRLDGIGDAYHVSGLPWRVGHGLARSEAPDRPIEIFSPCAAAALYRRDAFMDAGGFDPSFFCYVEDVDLGFRLRLMGHRTLYVPKAVVEHIGSALTGRRSDFSTYHGHRNLVWTFVKDMPGVLFWLYLPQHLVVNLAAIVACTLRGQSAVILRAKRDAIRGLPAAWRQRRRVQATRRAAPADLRRVMTRGLLGPYLRRFALPSTARTGA